VIEKISSLFTISTTQKHTKIPVVETQEKPALYIKHKKTDQVHLVLGVRAFGVHHPDASILCVLNAVLGGGMSSRLFQKLRDEMGVGYYVRSNIDDLTDHGSLIVSTGVDTTRVSEVVVAILEECKKLRNVRVSDTELQKAKEYLIGSMYLNLETSDALAGFYGTQAIVRETLKTPEELKEKIQAVSADDIIRVAQSIFVDAGLNLAVIGPCEEEDLKKVLSLGV